MNPRDELVVARLRRDLPRLKTSLGRAPTRDELADLGYDALLLKRLEADGLITSKLVVIDATGARRRVYSLPRFRR